MALERLSNVGLTAEQVRQVTRLPGHADAEVRSAAAVALMTLAAAVLDQFSWREEAIRAAVDQPLPESARRHIRRRLPAAENPA